MGRVYGLAGKWSTSVPTVHWLEPGHLITPGREWGWALQSRRRPGGRGGWFAEHLSSICRKAYLSLILINKGAILGSIYSLLSLKSFRLNQHGFRCWRGQAALTCGPLVAQAPRGGNKIDLTRVVVRVPPALSSPAFWEATLPSSTQKQVLNVPHFRKWNFILITELSSPGEEKEEACKKFLYSGLLIEEF